MAFFRVESTGGASYGIFEAETAAEALAMSHRRAGVGCSVVEGVIVFGDADQAESAGQVEDWDVREVPEAAGITAAWIAAERNPNTYAGQLAVGQVVDQIAIEVTGEWEWREIQKALAARGLELEDIGGGQEQVVEA